MDSVIWMSKWVGVSVVAVIGWTLWIVWMEKRESERRESEDLSQWDVM